MSGHSKWAQIKRQKGAADERRGKMFTKLANAITVSVRQGGGMTDPEHNFKLRLAIDRARAINMPKENIERALRRAQSKQEEFIEEVVYEGFAIGGVALIIEAVTDNRQRTVSEIKNILEKGGGRMTEQGSVSYLFSKKGFLVIKKNGKSIDEILSVAVEAGVVDMEDEDGNVILYTPSSTLRVIEEQFRKSGFTIESSEIGFKPNATISLDKDVAAKVTSLIDRLETLDDVQAVYSNLEESATNGNI